MSLPVYRTKSATYPVEIFTRLPSKSETRNTCFVVLTIQDLPQFEKYGNSVFRICLVENEVTREEQTILEQSCLVCTYKEDVKRFLEEPSTHSNLSYRIDGFKGMRRYYFHLFLKGAHFLPTSDTVDIHKISLRGIIRKDTYEVQSRVKSLLDFKHSLSYFSKTALPRLNQRANVFVPQSWNIDSFSYPSALAGKVSASKKGVYIAKPIGEGASSGKGITVFDSAEGFERAKKTILEQWPKGVVSEYIRDPYLFQGKKFHLRCYMFVSTNNKVSSLYTDAKILTASSPYIDDNYGNRLIHDTHMATTEDNYYFLKHYPGNKDKVWKQVTSMFNVISRLRYKGYPEAVNSYDILGVDILVDSLEKCWLLEVNFQPGLDPVKNSGYKIFEKKFEMWETSMIQKLL